MISKNITISLAMVLLMACSPKEDTVKSELNNASRLTETPSNEDELALDMLDKQQAKINEQTLISSTQASSIKDEESLLSDAQSQSQSQSQSLEKELFETQNLQQLAKERALIDSAKLQVQKLDDEL